MQSHARDRPAGRARARLVQAMIIADYEKPVSGRMGWGDERGGEWAKGGQPDGCRKCGGVRTVSLSPTRTLEYQGGLPVECTLG